MNPFGSQKRRPWHKTLPQSLENPLQVDRLPDTSRAELEYPVVQHTPAENRRYTAWLLFLALLVCAASLAGQILTSMVAAARYFQVAFASGALLLFFTQVPGLRLRTRLLFSLLLWPAASLALLFASDRLVLLALGMLASLFLADRFAAHFFYLKTAMPMPKDMAETLRSLWKKRFAPVFSSPKGMELYWLTLVAIFAVFFFVLWSENRFDGYTLLPFLLSVFPALFFLFFIPVAVELLASFLTARRRLPIGLLLRSFASALVHWFTYNRENSQAAAVFQSPAGTQRQRRWMSLAAVAMLAASLSQFLYPALDFSAVSQSEPEPPPKTDQFIEPFPDFSLPPQTSVPATYQRLTLVSLSAPSKAPLLAEDTPSDELELEPWQEGLQKRASPEDQKRYLERWRTQKAPPDDKPEKKADASPEMSVFRKNPFPTIAGFLAFLAVFVFLAAAFPLLWFLAICFGTSASVATFYAHRFSIASPEDLLNPENWEAVVTRLRTSPDRIEKDSLFLGVNAHDGTPVIVPRSIFHEHAHLLGDSGAGKTSIGLAGLISQLIRFGDASLVVIDLKADDLALFRNTRTEARYVQMRLRRENPEATYRFRWFTSEIDHSTYIFNPLTQRHFEKLTIIQRADVLTAAFGLHYGTEYGRSHYSSANTDLLFSALERCPNPKSFMELSRVLGKSEYYSNRLLQDASHLVRVVRRLAAQDPLNATSAKKENAEALRHAIDFADLFETPQVAYFHLPSAIGSTGAAEIGRLALYSLLSAAKNAGPRRKQVYLLIDEFQIMAASNLEFILQTARSMNIGVILANQSLNSLKNHGESLIPTVRACTRLRQVFGASDYHDHWELIETSGESLVHSRTWSQYLGAVVGLAGGGSIAASETVTPRLRANDILLATDHPRQSILHIRRGDGYAQFGGMPFVMTSTHHITHERYLRRKESSWPKHRPGETIVSKLTVPKITTQVTPAVDPDGAPDPVLEDPAPSPSDTSSPPAQSASSASDTIEDFWRSQEKREASRKKHRERKKPRKSPPNPKDEPDE